MKVCSDCGRKVALDPKAPGTARIFRQHFSGGAYTYRCWDCQEVRMRSAIQEHRRALGLPTT